MPEIAVNGRFRRQRLTGTQRVAAEIAARLKIPHRIIEPREDLSGGRGHAWEQIVLPLRARGQMLWGPCNTGPVAGRRQIVTIHDAAVLEHPEWFAPNFARLYGRLLPILARRIDRVVTVSEFSRERLSALLGIGTDRIEVVPNGVSDHFRPVPAEQRDLPPALAGRPYFATLFTREPRKNLDLVLQAWKLAKPMLPPGTALAIIGGRGAAGVFGEGSAVNGIDDDGVVYCGYLPDAVLPGLLSGAWGLVYPSLYEGFGLPALEAMACGTPTIVTALTSLPEVCGDAALYVDAHDPRELAEALLTLAGDPGLRAALARKGIERARTFTWDRAAARMDNILSEHV
ncbi:glycosyltransferase family 4 protein [Sphingomonas crusticola]|uniref:glycosyltransferase family 4 protein n=1 Tax=Sphingomonas crusticola TaxID=1697973 RepID=UPI000E22630A|nr:glycosyltransferase family 1 protein [Sphingomonas crusticola]